MSHTRDMMRKHSDFYQAKRNNASGTQNKAKPMLDVHREEPKRTSGRSFESQPPDYYQRNNSDPFSSPEDFELPTDGELFQLPTDGELPSYDAAFTHEKPPPVKTIRKGHRLSDFFGAAFTGYVPKERAPAFEVFEPRRRESMGAMPGAVEVRRCTGGMSSSGKKKEKKVKKGGKEENYIH